MCGIVGVMDFSKSAIVADGMSAFMQLLHAGAVRGMHGTGVFAVDTEGSNYRLRIGGPPHKLVESAEWPKFETFVAKKFVRFLVGHNRFATRGGISTATAHPFRDGEIILLHNGTLDSFDHLPDAKKYNVDSEAICHAISVQGPEKTIASMKGAWTLIWYDGQQKALSMIRNSERPLWLAKNTTNDTIMFASERNMLNWVLERNGKYGWSYHELPENQLTTYKLDSIKPHVKELKGKASSYFDDKGWEAWGKDARQDQVGVSSAKVEKDAKILELPFNKKASYSGGGGGSSQTKQVSLPSERKKSKEDSSSTQKGYWVGAEAIHDISKRQALVVCPLDFRPIDTEKARADNLFQIKALSDQYPDIEFFCNVKGHDNLQSLMDAPEGMRAQVKSILRSMNLVAQFPHQIYLDNPEPVYTLEPASIPPHATH